MMTLDYNTRQQLKQFIDSLDGSHSNQTQDIADLKHICREFQAKIIALEERIKELEEDASYLLEKDPDYAGAPPCPTT